MRKAVRHARPRLERLEERCTPAVFTVNTLADTVDDNPGDGAAADAAGNTSLRAAIQEANVLAGTDTIKFATTLTGSIQLSIALDTLNSDINIEGPGAGITVTRASGAANFRIFKVNTGKTCKIQGLSITGGEATETGARDGAAIWNDGDLDVIDCVIYGNHAGGWGGGIYNGTNGLLDLSNTWVFDNAADDAGGGLYNSGTADVYADTRLFANSSGTDGGGAYNGGTLYLTGVLIYDNVASRNGGGVYSGGSLTVEESSVEDNTAGDNGGGLYLSGSESSATLINALIKRNAAEKGGGVYVYDGASTFNNCTVTDNTASVLGPGICYRNGIASPPVIMGGGTIQSYIAD